jgi:hypothetical protein
MGANGRRQRVMRGLDPRIHLLRKDSLRRWMDCRVTPGNDEFKQRRPRVDEAKE